jgi:hypothetical protein
MLGSHQVAQHESLETSFSKVSAASFNASAIPRDSQSCGWIAKSEVKIFHIDSQARLRVYDPLKWS